MPSQSRLLASLPPSVSFEILALVGAGVDSNWLLLLVILFPGAILSLIACLLLWRKQVAQRQTELEALGKVAELALRAQDETAALQEALRLFAQVTHCFQACIYLTQDGPGLVVVLRYPWPGKPCETCFASELLHNVVESQRVQIMQPGTGSRAGQGVGVPLSAGRQTLGVLCALIPFSRFSLNPRETWLSAFGNSLGIVVENMRLFLAARQDLSRLIAVQELHRGINSTLDPNRLAEVVLEKICGFLDLEAADLFLTNGADSQLTLCASLWPAELGAPDAGQAYRKGLAERVMDARHALFYPNLPAGALESAPFASYVGVPLIIQEQWIGVLSLYSLRALKYDKEEINFLSTIGGLVAVAIDNARLTQAARTSEAEAKRQTLYRERIMESLTEVAQTSKLASIGRLAAGVAHELNNPLTAILGNAQYLRGALHDKDVSQQLKIIESQAQRAARIVRSLLSFARNHPQERTPTDLNDTIRDTLELINHQLQADGISLAQELDPELPWIEANFSQLQQVVLNLLVNAQQAIKDYRGQGTITVATTSNHKVVRFSCTDDGPGVAPQVQGDLFKPFVTTKKEGEGTGLGLSICRQIISEHNGRIWVETAPGKGSTFFFELPLPGARA